MLRDTATDFLQFMIVRTDTYAPAVPLLRSALERAGTRQVVDLCSGLDAPGYTWQIGQAKAAGRCR